MSKNIKKHQSGAALLFTLIALLILLAAAIAVARSMQTSFNNAGNLAFRRDLINHAEQALVVAIGQEYNYKNSNKNKNYSASILEANTQGIPLALLKNAEFTKYGTTNNDITLNEKNIKIRFIVERLCEAAEQSANDQGKEHCLSMHREVKGGSSHQAQAATPPLQPIYRISAKVTGPRNTEVFIQSTFTKEEKKIEESENEEG